MTLFQYLLLGIGLAVIWTGIVICAYLRALINNQVVMVDHLNWSRQIQISIRDHLGDISETLQENSKEEDTIK